ncbi:GTP-binding protein Era [Anaeromyxobacter sp. K]|uniref:GTPase Era n=1 Tax=Anaeromyxobacter sp. (strain K) TaxID=447217 RepID=UPI00015F8455|nr:GTPase Era [Anaeromyxobacter sp. K]ACG73432.1 GTP-binding protein Era [Anaeromyxobacter sp. K]
MASKKKTPFRAGFVAIVGRPNVGKSTLLNRVLGEHVAIVSPRPQTTRTRILGVHNVPGAQVAFFDTPGLHKAKGALNRRMVETALSTLSEVDAVLMLIEAGTGPEGRVEVGESTRWAIDEVRRARKPAVLGVNKMDRAPRATLLPVIDAYRGLHDWADIVPFSALTGENVDTLVQALIRRLPESDAPLFPADVLTDQAERALAAEYVREQVMLQTRQEIPYSAAVEVEEFDESGRRERGGLVRISALVVVERDSQKAIVIGKQGAMLKKIGTRAREGLERLLGCKVFLSLTVKVDERWSEREGALKRFGL